MRILSTTLLALTIFLLAEGFVFASDAGITPYQAKPGDGPSFWVTIAVTGLSLAIAASIGALGQSKAIAASVEAIARQPEAGGRIFVSMIIGLALIETLVIYTLVIAFMMINKVG